MSNTETDTTELTSVREQLAIMDTGGIPGRPQLWYAEIGEIEYTALSVEQWLKPSKLSGGRIALRIELEAIDVTQWLTVESDTLRMFIDDSGEETGPYLRSVFASAVDEQQREGFVTMRPVLRAETPLAGESDG